HWISGQNSAFERLADALLHRRNKFFRNRTALDHIVELEALGVIRLHPELGARVLAAATGLFLVRVVVLAFTANGFAISHLRLADVGADIELALHALHDD